MPKQRIQRNLTLANKMQEVHGEINEDVDWITEEAERYIVFLEGKEDRLKKLENVLNTIEGGDLPFKDDFLALFAELKSA